MNGLRTREATSSPLVLLLVEGSNLDRAATERIFHAAGLATVVRVAYGEASLQGLLRSAPDVVVVDATGVITEKTAATMLREAGLLAPLVVVGSVVAGDAPYPRRARLTDPLGLAELVRRMCPSSSSGSAARLDGLVADYPLLFERNPDAMWLFDLDSLRFLAANEAAARKYGYTPEQFLDMTLLDVSPPDQVPLLRRYFERAAHDLVPGEARVRDFQHLRRDGSSFDVEITWDRVAWHGHPAGLAVAVDVTAASRGERLVLGQNGLLDMIARGEPLTRVLEALVLLAERDLPGLLGSVLLLDEDGLRVRHGAAPSLPLEYTRAIDGAPIGPRAGSCGTAAYFGQAVIVPDIRTDARWDGYREVALPHGLVACWSTPIKAASGKVLGTFALYHRDPRSPTDDELGFVEIMTAVARIAIERERSDRALDASNRALRALIDAAPGAIVALDRAALVRTWNPAAEQIFGWSAAEVLGRPAPMMPEGLLAPPSGGFAGLLHGDTGERRELRCRRKDGSAVWVDAWTAAVPDAHGLVSSEMAIFVDVTERREAAEALRRSANAQAAILDALPAYIALIDGEGVILAVNKAWSQLCDDSFPGGSCTVGSNYLARLGRRRPPSSGGADEASNGVRAVLAGRAAQFETEYALPGPGEPRWYRLTATPLVAGELRGAVVMYLDVTASKLAEESVRESQERYRQIFENDVTGDLVSRPDGTIVECNLAFARIFGFASVDEPRGTSEVALFPAPALRTELVARVREEHTVASIELGLRRRDGKPVYVLATVVGTFDRQGELSRVSWYFLDRTEQKQLEQQLRQAQKMEAVGLLAGGVAHDFNNVLTVINSYSELLLRRVPPGSAQAEMLNEIRSAGDSATELTQQLLAFGRKQVLRPVNLDLNELVAGVEKMLRRLLGEDIELCFALEPDPGIVYADWGQIEQVVVNLAVNARDAMPTGGRLTVETHVVTVEAGNAALHPGVTPGRYMALMVRDEGLGMSAETCARIFEPFFTTKESGKGSGLGLAIVYGIVRQSGGFVGVESAPGEGATFTAYLPLGEGPGERRERARVEGREATGTETVLLAEDADAIRVLCRHALVEHGYHVLEARHGQEALELCTGHTGDIHMLVTDVVMPQMSGRALADRVRALRPGIKVLYVSGYTDDAIMRHGVSEDAVAFLPKPFTPSVLLRRVREILDGGQG